MAWRYVIQYINSIIIAFSFINTVKGNLRICDSFALQNEWKFLRLLLVRMLPDNDWVIYRILHANCRKFWISIPRWDIRTVNVRILKIKTSLGWSKVKILKKKENIGKNIGNIDWRWVSRKLRENQQLNLIFAILMRQMMLYYPFFVLNEGEIFPTDNWDKCITDDRQRTSYNDLRWWKKLKRTFPKFTIFPLTEKPCTSKGV